MPGWQPPLVGCMVGTTLAVMVVTIVPVDTLDAVNVVSLTAVAVAVRVSGRLEAVVYVEPSDVVVICTTVLVVTV